MTIDTMRGYLTFLSPALAQDPKPVLKRAAAKDQSANVLQQSQFRKADKVLAEHQRLLDEETITPMPGSTWSDQDFATSRGRAARTDQTPLTARDPRIRRS